MVIFLCLTPCFLLREFLRSLRVSRISSCCGLVALSHVFISVFVLRQPLQRPVISSMVQMDMQGDTMPVFLPIGVSGVGIGVGVGVDIGRGDGGVVVGYRESQNGEDCKGIVGLVERCKWRGYVMGVCCVRNRRTGFFWGYWEECCKGCTEWILGLCLSVAFALVFLCGVCLCSPALFKRRASQRQTRAFCIDGKTQDERAVGEVSFAHGGCGGTKFPRKRPRVSGARKRLLRTRAKREMRSLLFKSARLASRNTAS